MDTYLAVASKRDWRSYAHRPVPDDVTTRILDAGRLAGSSRNKQQREFVIVSDRETLAEAVFEPRNVLGAALVVPEAQVRAPEECERRRGGGSVGRDPLPEAAWRGLASVSSGTPSARSAKVTRLHLRRRRLGRRPPPPAVRRCCGRTER